MELMNCPNLAVPDEVMHHVVRVESSNNPYAIGVVGGRLVRQPQNLAEALATVRMLEGKGYNFSIGLAQVNRYNLGKYGLDSYEKAFQACPNLEAGSRILAECYSRSGRDWGKSFSCYYSGNFVTGFRHGYVQKIYASMGNAAASDTATPAIAVIARPGRRPVTATKQPSSSSAVVAQRMATPEPPRTVAVAASTAVVAQPQTASVATTVPDGQQGAPVGSSIASMASPDRAFVF
ncbi:lytic transglycosylase domain-containing protein [Lysobacter solisilvae (ex Woo and Kim 2020)]|nr:lytic transglycosylase domain-containing protein [Lysobacter terrestris]